jgi:hypothetical protein
VEFWTIHCIERGGGNGSVGRFLLLVAEHPWTEFVDIAYSHATLVSVCGMGTYNKSIVEPIMESGSSQD